MNDILYRLHNMGRAEEKIRKLMENPIFDRLSKHDPYWQNTNDDMQDKLTAIRCGLDGIQDSLSDIFELYLEGAFYHDDRQIMKLRPPKETDQEETKKAFAIIQECMTNHPEIEGNMWAGVFWSAIVNGYSSCGMPYELFCKECDSVKEHYKSWFER